MIMTIIMYIKGTVSVILCDSSSIDDNALFCTTVPLKALSDQLYELDIDVNNFKNWLFSTVLSLENSLAQFYFMRKHRIMIYQN